jgi:hypothetical protein
MAASARNLRGDGWVAVDDPLEPSVRAGKLCDQLLEPRNREHSCQSKPRILDALSDRDYVYRCAVRLEAGATPVRGTFFS